MRRDIEDRAICPEALRCPELHDFGDLPRASVRANRPLLIALAIAAILIAGHFAFQGSMASEQREVVQQATPARV